MRRLTSPRRSPFVDLVAFIMVLATGVTLVALGLSPESLAAVAIALASLSTVWRTGRPSGAPPSEADARQDEPSPAEKSPEGGDALLAGDPSEDGSVR